MAVGTYALTTLVKLKAYLNLTITTNDTLLEGLIDRVTSLFEGFTNRNLEARDYSYISTSDDYDSDNAIVNGNNRHRITLPQYPVNSLTTLRISTLAISERSSVTGAGWVIEEKGAGILALSGYIFTGGVKNVELVYNGGFSTIPDALEQAAIEQAAWMYKQSPVGSGLLGVSNKSLPDGSISYTVRDLLPQVRMVLEKYKNRFVV